jgi:hypothetical protein
MNTHKICNICNLLKSLEEFYRNKKGHYSYCCKKCHSDVTSSKNDPIRQRRKAEYDKLYRELNKARIAEYKAKWYEENKNGRIKDYKEANRKHIRDLKNNRIKQRRKEDPAFAIYLNLRARLSGILSGKYKPASTVESLGCSPNELVAHIESKFYPNPDTGEMMSWDNKGLYGWHIDHIIPLEKFDLEDKDQFLKACHYTNLQPLWAKNNLKKGSK